MSQPTALPTVLRALGGALAAGLVLGLLAGCQPTDFQNQLPTDELQINAIVNSANLTVQQKRQALADLGIPPSTINLFLNSERTGNQFGGDIRSAYAKVVGGQYTRLTPDEIQIYADEASAVDGPLNVVFSDEQAQNISIFFDDNFLNTADELEFYLDNPDNADALPGQVTADDLRAIFVEFEPERVLERL